MTARDTLAAHIEDFFTRDWPIETNPGPGVEAYLLADRLTEAGYIHRDHAPMLAIDHYLKETK